MLLLAGAARLSVVQLLARYGLDLRVVDQAESIPASYWGGSEAGLKGNTLFARWDTPVHSLLHEASHYVCMTPERRAGLERDAGGDDAEESAVCYLQILFARELPAVGAELLCADMDTWGYSFRLGSAERWFNSDAEDARAWLIDHGVLRADGILSGELRL
jgi:hypothetical protein